MGLTRSTPALRMVVLRCADTESYNLVTERLGSELSLEILLTLVLVIVSLGN